MAPISNPSCRKAEAGGSGVLSRSPIPREFKASLGYMKPWEGGEGRQGGGGRGGKKEEEGRERRKEREKEGRRTGKGRERGKGTLESTDWANFLENTKDSSIKGWANEKVKTSWDAYRCHESSGRGGGGVSVESPLMEAEGQLLGPCQASSDLKSNLKPRCLEDT